MGNKDIPDHLSDAAAYFLYQHIYDKKPHIPIRSDALSNIKPISITDLVEKYKEVSKPEFTYTEQISDFLRKHVNEVDNQFRKVLEKRGISEEEWKCRGTIEYHPSMTNYKYNDEVIFFVTHPEVSELKPGDYKATLTFYYGELN